jgi:hypothetical protein
MGTSDRRKGKEGEEAMKAIADRLRKLAQEAVEIAELIEAQSHLSADDLTTSHAGKGRVGMTANCPVCGKQFTVKVWNHVFCSTDCGAKANGFADADTRKTAWAKGRKA